jgi:hypothetical protein
MPKKKETKIAERVIITRPFMGLAAMQVCVIKGATNKEILEICNSGNPSGTSNGWTKVVRRGTKDRPDIGPVQCADHPDRIHYLVLC